MQQFWNRYIELVIGDLSITSDDMDIEYLVKNSTGEEVGSTNITVFNLAEATRQLLKAGTAIILKAGYSSDYGIVFSGTVKEVEDETEGADVATKIYCHDAAASALSTTISLRYPKGTAYDAVARDLFGRAGIPLGRVETVGLSLATDWTTGKRTIADALRYLVGEIKEIQDTSYNSYVKNGAGYFVKEDSRYEEGYVLSSETGLIEVQRIDEEDAEADYKIKTLMLWRVTQDSLLDIASVKVEGMFRVVNYEKVARGDDYYVEMEVKAA